MKIPCLIIVYLIISFKISFSQTLQQEDPTYLPLKTENVVKAPNYSPRNDLINVYDQYGEYPYKGHDCGDISMAYIETTAGKKYGNLEYGTIFMKVTQYGSQSLQVFNQTKPYDLSITELNEFASSSQAASINGIRHVSTEDVNSGKMVFVTDDFSCPEGKFGSYTLTNFKSIALVGTTIINISGSYYSDDKSIAKQVHSEIVSNIGTAMNRP